MLVKMKKTQHNEDFGVVVKSKIVRNNVKKFEKPIAYLIGQNGNIFNLMGIASNMLIASGKKEQAKEMCEKIKSQAKNYDEALLIIMEYVEVE
ncbi:MAG: hypothetical protein K2N51_07775 [Lachnospiraceae bacterium]|nr:hypothetical protein [Lachnospiraceae bacterium]